MEPPEAVSGPIVRLTDAHPAADEVKGKVVVYDSQVFDQPGIQALLRAGAAAVVSPISDWAGVTPRDARRICGCGGADGCGVRCHEC